MLRVVWGIVAECPKLIRSLAGFSSVNLGKSKNLKTMNLRDIRIDRSFNQNLDIHSVFAIRVWKLQLYAGITMYYEGPRPLPLKLRLLLPSPLAVLLVAVDNPLAAPLTPP